ncbi:MAG: hypothetical protein IPL26_01425 [Leptospiraceae bacterium]|nr:hypothetical protein [Leptospiraceae bacterium]
MKPIKIKKNSVRKILQRTRNKAEVALGLFLFNGFKIQVSRYRMNSRNRVRILYNKRRTQGLCVICQKRVIKINPLTGNLYRLCENHRVSIDKQRNKKRKRSD